MIARRWRGCTRAEDRHDFTNVLQARTQAELKVSDACRGAYVLQRHTEDGRSESLVLTLYDPAARGASVPPADFDPPLLSQKESRLLLTCDQASVRYDVIIDPHRERLYAELRRRFPLRFASLG
jgi:hypothetical protein